MTYQKSTHYLILFFIIILLKIILYYSLPFGKTPDSSTYITVAQNIFQNQCVSKSLPASHECLPDWGGNQFFGYPLFLSITQNFNSPNHSSSIFFQYLILTCAIFYFCHILYKFYDFSYSKVLIIAILLSLSPFQIGWSRTTLTESLTIPLIIFLFSEILKSLSQKKISTGAWSFILIYAIFNRYDMVVFCLAVPIVALSIYPFIDGIKKTILIAVFISLAVGCWIYRGYINNLQFPPSPSMAKKNLTYPAGVFSWTKTWSDSNIDNPRFIWKITGANYSSIKVIDKMYDNDEEKKIILNTIENLAQYNGKSIPKSIDYIYAELARTRITHSPINYWVTLPFKRIISMFSDFSYSNNLPIILDATTGLKLQSQLSKARTIHDYLKIIIEYPINSITRIILGTYKLIIYCLFIYLFFIFNKLDFICKSMIITTVICSLCSILFTLIFGISTETRYLLNTLISMEITVFFIYFKRYSTYPSKKPS